MGAEDARWLNQMLSSKPSLFNLRLFSVDNYFFITKPDKRVENNYLAPTRIYILHAFLDYINHWVPAVRPTKQRILRKTRKNWCSTPGTCPRYSIRHAVPSAFDFVSFNGTDARSCGNVAPAKYGDLAHFVISILQQQGRLTMPDNFVELADPRPSCVPSDVRAHRTSPRKNS